jgi:hypothetical protein
LSSSTVATYIFTAPTCTTTIITLEPCALNAAFQHFISRFNNISLLCRYHRKRGLGPKAEEIRGETEGDFTDKSIVQSISLTPNSCKSLFSPLICVYGVKVTKWWNAKAIFNNMMFSTNSNLIRSGHCTCSLPFMKRKAGGW